MEAVHRQPPTRNRTAEDIVNAAEDFVPILRELAVTTDADRRITDEVYRQMEEAGFFHILKPKKYGGLELGEDVHAKVTMTLAQGCASTAWVFSILDADNSLILCFPEEVQDEVWGTDSYATLAGYTGYNPNARVEAVEGGYRVSGSWAFCSGSDFSKWLVFVIPIGEQGEAHVIIVPNEKASTVDDWFPTGMRGTGSRTKVLEDVFIPERHVLTFPELQAGWVASRELHPTFDMLQTTFPSYGKFEFAGVAVGAAIAAVEYFAQTAGSSTRVAHALGGNYSLAEQDYVASEFAQASGDVLMAQYMLERQSHDVTERTCERVPSSELDLATWNRNYSLVTRTSLRAVNQIATLIGAKTGNPAHPVSRAKRDIEMLSHHVTLNWRQAAVQYFAAATASPAE